MTSAGTAMAAEPARPAIVSFVSPGPHSGRSSLVANLAWMIASSGHDVLVLDGDQRDSSIPDLLGPFLIGEAPLDQALDAGLAEAVAAAMPGGTGSPKLRRHRGTGPAGARLDLIRSQPAGDAQTPDDYVFVELRRLLLGAGYEFVLIAGRSTGPPATGSRDGLLADTVVVCFRPDRNAYEPAAALAVEVVRHSPVRPRIVAAPGFFDVADPGRSQEQDAEIRSALLRVFRAAGPRLDRAAETLVQVPVPLYVLPDGLAALAFQAPEQQLLLSAYEQLLAAVTGNPAGQLPAAPSLVGDLYRRALESARGARSAAPQAEIGYHPADRPWADWARDQLDALGVPARLRRLGDPPPASAGPQIVVLSQHSCGAVTAVADALALKVDGVFDEQLPPGAQIVDVAGCTATEARRRFRAALACSGDRTDRTGANVPFPGRPAPRPRWHVDPLDPGTVDRAAALEALRDHLPPRGAGRVLLYGGAATGKTELAKAFAHRFGYGYDTVWYVPAGSRQSARASLRQLGDELGVDANGDKAAAALRMLREDAQPYLLIYDDVSGIDAIADLLPAPASGHVIVVLSGEVPPASTGTAVAVGPLSPAEAEQALLRQLPEEFRSAGLPAVVEAVGTEPLTLRLTAGYLTVAAASLESSGRPVSADATATVRDFLAALTAGKPSWPRLNDVGRTLLGLLAGSPEGLLLTAFARMCAFLSPDGVSLRLIRSSPFLDQLIRLAGASADSLAQDTAEIEYTLARGRRAALFAVDWGRRERLRMHRGIQQMLRELTDDEQTRSIRSGTQLALAGYVPSDAQHLARGDSDELAELARHLHPSGALEEKSQVPVRRWVVLQTAYAALSGDPDEWAEAADTAEKVLGLWSAMGSDRLSTRLGTHHADLLRRLGKNTESLTTDLETLGTLNESLGPAHLRTSISLRGTAGDLRGLGLFAEARIEDVSVHRSFRSLLGPEHPQTLNALHNLALSNYLDGRQEDAVRREEEGFRLRLRLFGPDDYATWWAGLDLGIYLREVGRLAEAREQLDKVVTRLRDLRGEQHPLTLRATVALGVTMCRIAVAEQAPSSVSKARTVISQAVLAYEQVLGTDALETQAARMSLATVLAYHRNDLASAVNVARDALDVYQQRLRASHPFVGLCRVNLAALLRQDGQLDEAAEQATLAVEILDEGILSAHPWKLAARVNLANIRLCQGRGPEAHDLISAALATAENILAAHHPYLVLLRNSSTNLDSWLASAQRGALPSELVDIDVEIPTT